MANTRHFASKAGLAPREAGRGACSHDASVAIQQRLLVLRGAIAHLLGVLRLGRLVPARQLALRLQRYIVRGRHRRICLHRICLPPVLLELEQIGREDPSDELILF